MWTRPWTYPTTEVWFEVCQLDPMLVVRRHVDLQRVRSAICSDAR
ncbi:putative leader peptide [Nonomuraea dietziae]